MIATSPAPGGLSAEGAWGCLTHTAQPFPASADRQCTTALCGAGIMDVREGVMCAQNTATSYSCDQAWESSQQVVKFGSSSEFARPALTFGGGPIRVRATVLLLRQGVILNFANNAPIDQPGDDFVRLDYSMHMGGTIVFSVSRHGSVQEIRCVRQASWGNSVLVEGKIGRASSFGGGDGTGVLSVNGAQCAIGPLHIPEMRERRTNSVDTFPGFVLPDSGWVTNFEMSACMVKQPCPNTERVASFRQPHEFDQQAPLTFGGPMYMRASVYLNSYTTWGRIFDFGNGAWQKNVILTLAEGTRYLMLQVYRGGFMKEVRCTAVPLQLNRWTTVEVTIGRDGDTGADAIARIIIDGYQCGSGPMHLPETVQRSSNRIGRSNWPNDDLDGTVHNFVMTRCSVARPCPNPTSVVSVPDGASNLHNYQQPQMSFGGPMHISASVTLTTYTTWSRIIDFGNGPWADNIVVSLWGNTKRLAVSVYRKGVGQEIVCPSDVPLLMLFTVDVVLARGAGSAQGVATIYIDGMECVQGPLHLPEEVVRNKNYIGRSNWGDPSLSGTVHTLEISSCSLQWPCLSSYKYLLASFQQSSEFDQYAAMLSGGEMYVNATVTFNSYSPWARIFDFGDGAGQDDVIMSLADDSKQIVLDVWREGSLQRVQCTADPPLNTAVTVEATITRNPNSLRDGRGAIYIDGVYCAEGALHVPALLERSSNLIGRSNRDQAHLDGTVSNFELIQCKPLYSPCHSTDELVRFHDVSEFNQHAPLTFGGDIYVRARVTLNFYTPQGRVFDFGNGAGQDNVILKVVPNTKRLALNVFRDGIMKEMVCNIDLQLRVPYTIEVSTYNYIDFFGSGEVDWSLAVDGVVCGRFNDAIFEAKYITRSSNLIGRSNWVSDPPLYGTVSDFVLSSCPQW
eukprot:TRINITY_DN436_c0_g1_i1.p1 TRINITY_DN436_c0_g1~~TRINITY_DN436_c0_g1_i1.p1  ORF type:complete len:913 (+),score=205.38 TRINITY_DN436_c0_g1_i1:25-2739(+)